MIEEIIELSGNADRVNLCIMPRNDGTDIVAVVFHSDIMDTPISLVGSIDEIDSMLEEAVFESPSRYLRKFLNETKE